jgi:hypothetical protein
MHQRRGKGEEGPEEREIELSAWGPALRNSSARTGIDRHPASTVWAGRELWLGPCLDP